MYDIETPIKVYFGQVLTARFNDPGVAYDTIEFVLGNAEMLLNSTNIFTKYVPNLLKILAWSPMTFVADFLQLLPACVSLTTASEVLHSLLDLPCLSATLQAQYLVNAVPNITDQNLLPQYNRCLASYQDTAHKLMFGHFLRSETGRGDTIDRLGNLHLLLSDFSQHQRVLAAAQVAPQMVRMFFKTVLHSGDVSLVSQLVPVLIERATVLFAVPTYQTEMREVIAEQLLVIFRHYPHLVVDYYRDIIDYLRTLRNLTSSGEHFYVHLVWSIGEYTHLGYDSRWTSSLLVELFETLEPVTYEVALNLHYQRDYSTRLVLVLMSSLAKIASRCQDLIPRALLCLNKIVQLGKDSSADSHTQQTLLIRANELVNVLKIPSIASAILSPAPHSSQQQELQQQTDLAHLLKATSLHLDH
jgi:AP-5 complex subunit zeta-1